MPISFVQTAALASAVPVSTLQTLAFPANPTVGNYVVAWAWGWSGSAHSAAVTFSDTGGNAYTVPAGATRQISASLWLGLGYARVATSAASFTVTCTPPNAATNSVISVVACEFSGVAAASPQDGSAAGATGTTGVPAPGSLALTAGDLVACAFTSGQTNYGTFGYATPSGYTRAGFENDGNTNQLGEAIYAINHASPSAPSWKTGTVAWASAQLALLAAAAGAGAAYVPSPSPGIAGAILAL